MIPQAFKIRERGPVKRGWKKAHNQASKKSWELTGIRFHSEYSDKRFTQRHATEAGYEPRKREYNFRKFKEQGHTRPLEYSGETRRQVRQASVSATSNTARVKYPGARKFNFRHPNSTINMADEFRRVTTREANELATFYDHQLDERLNQD